MNVLTVYAHPNPKSLCHAFLERFDIGLKDAGHKNDIVDLCASRFDPVFRMEDFASDGQTPSQCPGEGRSTQRGFMVKAPSSWAS